MTVQALADQLIRNGLITAAAWSTWLAIKHLWRHHGRARRQP